MQELQGRLGARLPISITHDGMSFTLATDINVSASALLGLLLEAGVEVEYFREISRSTKRLFRKPD